jgi:hypothetical protein
MTLFLMALQSAAVQKRRFSLVMSCHYDTRSGTVHFFYTWPSSSISVLSRTDRAAAVPSTVPLPTQGMRRYGPPTRSWKSTCESDGLGDAVFVVLVHRFSLFFALCTTLLTSNNKHPYQNTIIHMNNHGPACPADIYAIRLLG